MVFSCKPNFAAKKQALKQKIAGAGAYHGVSLRLLLVDKQVDAQDVLPNAALASVHVVKYDAKATALAELVGLIREAHRQNGAPFLSMAIAQHGADAEGQWEWTTDLSVNLKSMHGAIDQLAPVIEVLAAALSKTKAGKAHIDLLACNLATTCKGLIPALEKMYGIDFRASTDETGNDLSGGDWKMETDNDYDVAADYLDAAKLKAYTETMAKGAKGQAAEGKAANDLLCSQLDTYKGPIKGTRGKNKAGPSAGGTCEGCCAKCKKANIQCLCNAVEQMKASLGEYACELQRDLTLEVEKKKSGRFGNIGAKATAEIEAHARCDARANMKDGVNLAAEVGAAARIELEFAAGLGNECAKLDGKIRGAFGAFAWAAAKAHLSTAGLYAELGAKAGYGPELEASGALVLADGAIMIEFKCALDAVTIGLHTQLGCKQETPGVYKLYIGAGLHLGAGFEGYIAITIDLTKLTMPSLYKAKGEYAAMLQKMANGKGQNTEGQLVSGDGWIRCSRQVADANACSFIYRDFEEEFDRLLAAQE